MRRVRWRWGWCARGEEGQWGGRDFVFLVFDVMVMADEKKVGSEEGSSSRGKRGRGSSRKL